MRLPAATCELVAGPERLTVTLTGDDEAAVVRLREVVAEHLQRFATKETLAFDWRETDARSSV